MGTFGMVWAAMKRFASSLNKFSDELDAMTSEAQNRRLGFAPGEVIDGNTPLASPEVARAALEDKPNGVARRKAASA